MDVCEVLAHAKVMPGLSMAAAWTTLLGCPGISGRLAAQDAALPSSYRAHASPTRPRWTPSPLIMMNDCSMLMADLQAAFAHEIVKRQHVTLLNALSRRDSACSALAPAWQESFDAPLYLPSRPSALRRVPRGMVMSHGQRCVEPTLSPPNDHLASRCQMFS